jgi:hypothetical protein
MENKIIFRVWDGKQMEYSELDSEFDCISGWLDGCVVNQYIGGYGTDGKKIYSGDIICFAKNPYDYSEGVTYDIVVWGEMEWATKERKLPMKALFGGYGRLLDQPNYKIRVVGNIYETPEHMRLTEYKFK